MSFFSAEIVAISSLKSFAAAFSSPLALILDLRLDKWEAKDKARSGYATISSLECKPHRTESFMLIKKHKSFRHEHEPAGKFMSKFHALLHFETRLLIYDTFFWSDLFTPRFPVFREVSFWYRISFHSNSRSLLISFAPSGAETESRL